MHKFKLVDDIVKCCGVCWSIDCGVMSVKWGHHVESIEPHLIGVSGAMPETSSCISRVGVKLGSEKISCSFVFCLPGIFVSITPINFKLHEISRGEGLQVDQSLSNSHIVKGIICQIIIIQSSFRSNDVVDPLGDVCQIIFVAGGVVNHLESFPSYAMLVCDKRGSGFETIGIISQDDCISASNR